MNKKLFGSLRELNITVTNPNGGNTNLLGIRKVEVSAFQFEKKAFYVPEYRLNLISLSSVFENGHKVAHEKKSFFCQKSNEQNPITRNCKFSFLRTTPRQVVHFANLRVGSIETELWNKKTLSKL